jgi:hypothetical protein
MTLPQRPEGMPEVCVEIYSTGYAGIVAAPGRRYLTNAEAEYAAAVLNTPHREVEELRALVRRMWERDILSSAELDAIENEMVRLGCISDEERRRA